MCLGLRDACSRELDRKELGARLQLLGVGHYLLVGGLLNLLRVDEGNILLETLGPRSEWIK